MVGTKMKVWERLPRHRWCIEVKEVETGATVIRHYVTYLFAAVWDDRWTTSLKLFVVATRLKDDSNDTL